MRAIDCALANSSRNRARIEEPTLAGNAPSGHTCGGDKKVLLGKSADALRLYLSYAVGERAVMLS